MAKEAKKGMSAKETEKTNETTNKAVIKSSAVNNRNKQTGKKKKARKKSSGSPINLFIKVIIVLIIVAGAAFAGFYFYNQRQMGIEAKVSRASTALEKQVSKNPLNADARVALAQAYINEGDYDKAIDQLKEALRINSEHQSAIVYMGIAYMKKEDNKNAEKYFMKEIEMFGGAGFKYENKYLEEAFFNMAVINFQKKDYDKALQFAAQATEIGRSDADNQFLMGRIYLAKGSYEEATIKFQEAMKFDPKFTDAHYGLAQAYEKLGDKDKAIEEYRTVIKLAPKFKEAQEALDRLEE